MIRKLAAVLAISLPLAAQVSETIEVAITSVDVVVTDAKGNRVRGLTRADFEVIEDGKPREITNFSEYALTAPPLALSNAAATVSPSAAPQPVLTPPRRLLILFDSNTLTPKHRRNGAADALKFIDKHVRPSDKVLVGVLTQQFTLRTDWTSDREELRRVINAIGSEVTANRTDTARKEAEQEMTLLLDLAASTLGADPRVVVPPRFEELVNVARKYAEQALVETRTSASLIEKLVGQFATYPEKKALIFIGEGLESRPGWELFEKLESIRAGKEPGVGLMISIGQSGETNLHPAPTPSVIAAEAGRYNTSQLLLRLADSSYRKGVPIYAINPGTNEEPDTGSTALPDPGQQFARFASRADGYTMVGDGSGGAAYIGMRAELALDEVAADMGSYYSIGFRASGPPKRASIRVKPRQAGHRVRVALAGTPIGPADVVTDAVTAHHVLEPATNDLEIMLETLEPIAAGEKQKVTLHVIIPIRNLSLVRQGDNLTGGFDVYLSVSDGKGYFSPVNKQSHAIKWPASNAGGDDERTMTYSIDVTMEPGASQISVGVVDQRSKKTGYERISV